MWTWTLNWNEVRDDLVIGSCPVATDDIDRIADEVAAGAILSLQTDICRDAFGIDYAAHCSHGRRRGLVLANAPMRDFDPPDQRAWLADAVTTLLALLATGHRTYVHCTAGINRAPLTVLGYLSFVETMTPDAALRLIQAARPAAEPYWDAYNGCRADLVARNRDAIAIRADAHAHDAKHRAGEAWRRAESAVIRDVLRARAIARTSRLDPGRCGGVT